MIPMLQTCPNSTVILVGDIAPNGGYHETANLFDADNPTKDEVSTIQDWLETVGLTTKVISSVNEFLRAPPARTDGLVFPLWRGGISRSRTAVVPAVCESLNLPFVGGDAYVQSICQDKSLSKRLANIFGFSVPREVQFADEFALNKLVAMEFNFGRWLVKPLYGAASIGIDDTSIVNSPEDAKSVAKKLLQAGLGPVICEEYLEGPEVSLCLVGNVASHRVSCAAGFMDNSGNCPFANRPYTFYDKQLSPPPWSIEPRTIPQSSVVWPATNALLAQFGHVDLFRIDLKKVRDQYYLIELTPDIHLGLDSVFLGGFQANGRHPSEVLGLIVQSALHRLN